MGIVSGFRTSGLYAKTSFVLLLLAALCAWVSFFSPGWGESENGFHYGLWRICRDRLYSPDCVPTDGWALDWWASAQAFVTLGFVGVNLALLLTVLYMFVPSCRKNRELAMATSIVCIITGLLHVVGVVCFGVKFTEQYVDLKLTDPTWPRHWLTYCLGLSLTAILFTLLAGVTMVLDSKKWETYPVV